MVKLRQAAVAAQRTSMGDVIALGAPSAAIYCIFVLVVIAVAVASSVIVQFTRTETVSGAIRPIAGEARLSVPIAATIASVLVTEGQRVERGSTLMSLESDRALLSGVGVSTSILELLAAQQQELRTRHRDIEGFYAASQVQLAAQRVSLEQDQVSILRQIELQNQRLDIARERLAQVADLVDRGLNPGRSLQEAANETLSIQVMLEELESRSQRSANSVREINAQLARLVPEQNRELSVIRQAQLAIELEMDRVGLEGASTIPAPMSGTVGALLVQEGEVVTAGTMVATLLPGEGQLQAELWAPSRAVGVIRIGQRVRLKLTAFPAEQFGYQGGEVVSISRSILRPEDLAGPVRVSEPVYRVIVSLDRQSVLVAGEEIRLQPGMLLDADVVIRREPIWRLLFGAFRSET